MALNEKKKKEEDKPAHYHTWAESTSPTELVCSCGKALVSQKELDRREEEWEAFYQFCRTTEAYRNFQAMREAWKRKDINLIKEIREKIRSESEIVLNEFGDEVLKLKDPVPKPKFPDPLSAKETWRLVTS